MHLLNEMQEAIVALIAVLVAIVIVILVVVLVLTVNKPPAPSNATSVPAIQQTPPELPSPLKAAIPQEPQIVAPVVVDRRLKLLRTELAISGSCQSDSDCDADSICSRSSLLNKDDKPYHNNLFEEQGYSITDVTPLKGRLYFILDNNKVGIVDPLHETTIYQLDMNLQQIVTFNEDIYLRSGSRLYRLDNNKLVDVPTSDIEYLSVTPDGKYLYINNTLFGTNFRSVLKLGDKQPRVFLNPQTYLTLGNKPSLVYEGKLATDVTLPSVIVDAGFSKAGDLFLAEDGDKYRKVNIISEELFLLTRRICERR